MITGPTPRTPEAPSTVLVVEDDDELRDVLARTLAAEGLAVTVARDASAAVRAARRAPPHILLVDLRLPDLDGREVIRAVLGARPAQRPYVIVMSGLTDARTRQLAFESGCDAYVVKEAGVDALVAAVRAHLLRSRRGAAPSPFGG